MDIGFDWNGVGALVTALSALVGAPLTAIVFYLRAIREDQRAVQASLLQRIERMESECRRVEHSISSVQRDYTPRAEWLREVMIARDQFGRLTELLARLQMELESSRGLATQFVRATNAIIDMTERLSQRLAGPYVPGGADVRDGASRPEPAGRDD